VASVTGDGDLLIDVPQGTLAVKIDLAADETTEKLGVQYLLQLE